MNGIGGLRNGSVNRIALPADNVGITAVEAPYPIDGGPAFTYNTHLLSNVLRSAALGARGL